MDQATDARVRELKESVRAACSRLHGEPGEVAAAALLAALEIVAEPFRKAASPADRSIIKTHYAPATDETIDAHRIDQEGLMYIVGFATTAARKYLDHQPETSAIMDAKASEADLKRIVPAISKGIRNAFDQASSNNASAYDIAAATITNTVVQSLRADVVPEQLITILLENVERIIAHVTDAPSKTLQ